MHTCMHIPHTHKDQANFLAQCGQLSYHWIFLPSLKSTTHARHDFECHQSYFLLWNQNAEKHVWQRSRLFKPLLSCLFFFLNVARSIYFCCKGEDEGFHLFVGRKTTPTKGSTWSLANFPFPPYFILISVCVQSPLLNKQLNICLIWHK